MTAAAELASKRKRCPECGGKLAMHRDYDAERDADRAGWEWLICTEFDCDWSDIGNAREVKRGRKRSA